MQPDAPILREDIKDKTTGAHGERRTPTTSSPGRGDKAAADDAFAAAEVTVKELVTYQRVHPCPLETCACVGDFDKIKGEITIYGTFQAPHVVRTVVSLLSGIPEAKVHVIAPDIGGGFGNKVGVYPGYVCAIVGSIVLGRPVKWVEDRMENLSATAFARDYHMTAELPRPRTGGSPACAAMCWPTTAPSTPAPTPPSTRPASSTSAPAPTTSRRRTWSWASTPTRRRAASPTAARSG